MKRFLAELFFSLSLSFSFLFSRICRSTALGSTAGNMCCYGPFWKARVARNPQTGAVEPGNGRFRAAATPGVELQSPSSSSVTRQTKRFSAATLTFRFLFISRNVTAAHCSWFDISLSEEVRSRCRASFVTLVIASLLQRVTINSIRLRKKNVDVTSEIISREYVRVLNEHRI